MLRYKNVLVLVLRGNVTYDIFVRHRGYAQAFVSNISRCVRGAGRVISVSASKELILIKVRPHGRTDISVIWTRFGTTLAQIPVAAAKMSRSEGK